MNYVIMLVILLIGSTALANPSVRVLDRDANDIGIECEVKIEKENGMLVAFSYTDEDGWVKDEIKCEKKERIVFIPNDDYYTIYKRCPMNEKEVYVSSIYYGRNLLTNASKLLAAGEFGSAALAFSEAASRVKLHDANLSRNAETQAYEAAGKAFGVEQPTVIDPHQGEKVVISPELREAIENYQEEKDIEATGKLDFSTLRSISNKSVRQLMVTAP